MWPLLIVDGSNEGSGASLRSCVRSFLDLFLRTFLTNVTSCHVLKAVLKVSLKAFS